MTRTSATGFETRLLLTDGRIVPAALSWDGQTAVALLKGCDGLVPVTVHPHGAVDGLGFILRADQRRACGID